MDTIHDILRARLLARAGIVELVEPAPSLDDIIRLQSCPEFERLRQNRMVMGYLRYGGLRSQIGCNKYDNVGSIKQRLATYERDHNREHLVDIANLAMVEFVTHPDYPFKAADGGIHVTHHE